MKDRKRLRLKDYDYSQPGAYFVTACTKDREHRFGEIVDGEMRMNDLGEVVQSCWNELPDHYPIVQLDGFVVMPNHVHGIVIVLDRPSVGATQANDNGPAVGDGLKPVGATHASPPLGKRNRLGDIVGSFKSAVTKRVNEIQGTPGAPLWQRGYYDHIIRDHRSHGRIRDYIIENPVRWSVDRNNANAISDDEFDRWMNPSTN